MIRELLDDHMYYVFEAHPTKYERDVSAEDIERVNLSIKELEETKQIEQLDEEEDRISSSKMSDEEKKEALESLRAKRASITIELRKKSKKLIYAKRGALIDDSGVFEELDYNEEKLRWGNQIQNPHNVHTKIVEDGEGIHGQTVKSNGSEKFGAFSIDGEHVATANEAIRVFSSRIKSGDRLTITEDPDLVSRYIKYLDMCKQYEQQGLLVEQDGRMIVDLEHIEKYPGLQEFATELEEYKVAQRKIISTKMATAKAERDERRKKILPSIAESVKAMSEDKDVKKIIGEGEATSVLLDLEKDQVQDRGVGISDSN